MPFVLDASTALNLVLHEELATAEARAVATAFSEGETARVPSLWLLEIANVLVMSERRGRIQPGDGDRLLGKLLDLPISVAVESFGMAQRTVNIMGVARAHQLTAYDAAYLSLAESHGWALATGDKTLTRAARALSLPVMGRE